MATDSVARAIALAAKANGGKPGPAGPKGDDGLAATIQVGTVTTGAAGTNAEVTNVGTENAAVFNFTIPKGDTGEAGSGGLSTIVAGTGTSSIVMNHDDTNTNVASGNYSTALGYGTKAEGEGALAAGYSQTAGNIHAKQKGSIAMGVASGENKLLANSRGSIALGYAVNGSISAYSSGSTAIGYPNPTIQTNNIGALAGGYGSVSAAGQGSIAWGCSSSYVSAGLDGSVAIGDGVQAESAHQQVRGRYNIVDTENTYADIYGIGTSVARTNGYTLDWTGNATFAGTVTSASGADYAEYFEWKDGNKDSEDRVGYIVTLDGDKIVKAKAGDDILGIISGCATVIGDNAEWNWQGRFERDEFGRIIYDQVEQFIDTPDPDWEPNPEKPDEEVPMIKKSLGYFPVPRENADYDPTKEYANRSNRPEWDTVGMMGKLYVRDDGTAAINDYVTVSATTDGVATKAEGRTSMRVMERVNDHIIRVCFK